MFERDFFSVGICEKYLITMFQESVKNHFT